MNATQHSYISVRQLSILLTQLSVSAMQISILLMQLSILLMQISILLMQLSILLMQLSILLMQLSILLMQLRILLIQLVLCSTDMAFLHFSNSRIAPLRSAFWRIFFYGNSKKKFGRVIFCLRRQQIPPSASAPRSSAAEGSKGSQPSYMVVEKPIKGPCCWFWGFQDTHKNTQVAHWSNYLAVTTLFTPSMAWRSSFSIFHASFLKTVQPFLLKTKYLNTILYSRWHGAYA
jgi:hypothetical protein